jgi:ElaB/YqjD/DUF883 family membrane-anchored ribosome-binding protein
MIDANAYSLAINWALHEIKAQIRDTERERDFQTSDLRSEAKGYLDDHPEMLVQVITTIGLDIASGIDDCIPSYIFRPSWMTQCPKA